MAKWRYTGEDDESATFQKIRKAKKSQKVTKVDEPFEKPEKLWPKDSDEVFRARVVEVQKRYAFVAPEPRIGKIDTRDVWLATVARKYLVAKRDERNLIAVGDRVFCRISGETEEDIATDLPLCVIQHMAPRHSKIWRRDPHTPEREHILACNIDQMFIVASFLAPKVRWRLIDRFLVLAEEQNIPAIIVLTKWDLLEASDNEKYRLKCEEKVQLYRALGYQVFVVSTLGESFSDEEFVTIGKLFKGRFTIVAGHSGVGKSSLVNIYDPEIVQEVEENPDIFYKGRHTTTYASLIKLGPGGYVVDTPGIRSFLLQKRDAGTLSQCFVEFRPFLGSCEYRVCRHVDEPVCAIKEAVASGKISRDRYESYLLILGGDTGREGRLRDMS